MICRREMAHHFSQDRTTRMRNHSLKVNSIMNQKPKLPPILPEARNQAVQSSRSSLQQNQNFVTLPETVSLPRIGNSCQYSTRKACKNIDYPTFPFPHVYSVLPPIGKTFQPSAPSPCRKSELQSSENSKQHSDNNSPRRKRQASRKSRIKKQSSEVFQTSEVVTETEQAAVVDDKSVKTTQSSNERNEIFAIHVSDTMPEKERDLSTANKLDKEINTSPDEDELLLVARNIPSAYRMYADVYPVSPRPGERRMRYAVERKRIELKEDRLILVDFLEGTSKQRRNATCAELDVMLKNAVKLLKDIFLRQTMEELCMIW